MSAHVADRLSAYLDRELSVLDANAVREHLAACEGCAARLAHLAAVDGSLRDLPAEAPAGYFDSFAARVRGRIEAAPRTRAGFRLPVWSWAVAAAVLVAVILPVTLRESAAPPVPGRPRPMSPATMADEPRALQVPAKRGPQSRASAPATVEPEAAQKLRALGYVEPAERDDKTRAKATTEAADAMSRSGARKELPLRGANALPAAPPAAQAPAVPAEAAKAEGFSSEGATVDRTASEPILREQAETRPAESQVLKKDQRQEEDARATEAAGAPGRANEGKRTRQAAAAGMVAPAPTPPADEELRVDARDAEASLAGQRASWRAFAQRHPDDPRADDARVRVIALGVEIARKTGQSSDEALVRTDAADYLARKDALQKKRVRALLDDLSR